MLAMLKEVAPGIVRAAVIFGTNSQYLVYLHSFQSVSPTLAVELSAAAVRDTGEIEAAISELGRKPGAGLVVPPDAFTVIHHATIIELATRHQLPAVYAYRSFVAEGGLMSYGPRFVCRSHPEGREARRFASGSAGQVRVGHQCKDCHRPRRAG